MLGSQMPGSHSQLQSPNPTFLPKSPGIWVPRTQPLPFQKPGVWLWHSHDISAVALSILLPWGENKAKKSGSFGVEPRYRGTPKAPSCVTGVRVHPQPSPGVEPRCLGHPSPQHGALVPGSPRHRAEASGCSQPCLSQACPKHRTQASESPPTLSRHRAQTSGHSQSWERKAWSPGRLLWKKLNQPSTTRWMKAQTVNQHSARRRQGPSCGLRVLPLTSHVRAAREPAAPKMNATLCQAGRSLGKKPGTVSPRGQ